MNNRCFPPVTGLYDPTHERDACGIGLVADLNNHASSRRVVELAIGALERLSHRGASGGDPDTGDGAGILTAIPHAFFAGVLPETLPGPGRYAVAMIFGRRHPGMEILLREEGLSLAAWREVPTRPEAIGRAARESRPEIHQAFVTAGNLEPGAFDRALFIARRRIEKQCGILFCSFSRTSIVYKGLLQAAQLARFYPDLADPAFTSPLALVHQRYSTNTFPAWHLAHPFRYLAHNGEINTIKGNLNHLHAREPLFDSPLFGPKLRDCLPLMDGGESDSAALDRMAELLALAGRSLPHAMLMLMPQAWGPKYYMGNDVRAFFEYHSGLMEPWDGPAAVAFSDGITAGALLDRNGLRPARYTLTRDNLFILASEAGVVDVPAAETARRGRLRPGEMIWCNLPNHRLVFDREIKETLARAKPYRRWLEENRATLRARPEAEPKPRDLHTDLWRFHWSREDLERIVAPMSETGHEPIGSMGNDAALAVLSPQKPLLYTFFKQLFAQVTNPPIDPIREALVMSLRTTIGNPGNILAETPAHARLVTLPRPTLTDSDLRGLGGTTLPLAWSHDLERELNELALSAVSHVRHGERILILSDRDLPEGALPIPALAAAGAVNRALVEHGLRPSAGIIVQSGEVREVMHVALLLGFGATAVHPWLALACVENPENYLRAIDRGLLKIMSKMGISTLRSYRGAQIFEAVGLDQTVIDACFPGTASRMGGLTFPVIAEAIRSRLASPPGPLLRSGGDYAFRHDGENHLWSPRTLALFRQAVQEGDPEKYRAYADLINKQGRAACTLRSLFGFRSAGRVPIEAVESVDSILTHFVSGAMSLGSLSPEAHEAIAIAMNRLGAMSNCGEGGEDPAREGNRASAIRQVASGRFGVTVSYLAGAKELQIKMAQGAKPGEGGQLPGHKVDAGIARVRHSTPGVTLISPPPHHDIYSIEDLAQLISDLRSANPSARISVKLVSEAGIGAVAAGVAKAAADLILVSGHDGGTGASPLSSIKHAGLPWEIGLAETQQTLVLNNLRGRVKLQVDGQLKTGRDVVIGALLGAEEFGFATTLLVCLGCVMMRKCHDNTCPAGIATQDPDLRRCFKGKPRYIENFLRFLAEEVRELLAELGLRSLKEAVGRADLLDTGPALAFFRDRNLDFSRIFTRPAGGPEAFQAAPPREPDYDSLHILPKLGAALRTGEPAVLNLLIGNTGRSCGAALSGEIARRFGPKGLPEGTIDINLTGCAGQSFGAFLAPGVTLTLTGEANDFVGKGLSGGTLVVKAPEGVPFDPAENVIAGNVVGYGATSGRVFLGGQAGERFAIRNSGMTLVLEGGGDHGCEYMTGGRVVALGEVGVNFGAGMSGGIAYVYDRRGDFDLRCNLATVELESVPAGSGSEAELLDLIGEHACLTGSLRARGILANWREERARFVKIFPIEYKRMLQRKD